nr:glycosyltransferase [Enterococcus lemanii]
MLPARKKSVNKIVSIGRLVEQKNHALLIKAFAKVIDLFPNTELHIYGNGPLKLELENLARKLNVYEKVFINNAIPDVLSKVSDAKLFVLSSNYEGMPNVLIEMMAIGIPVIATDCPIGGPREIIEDGINGLLVPVNDTTELSKKIIQIIDDKEFAKELTKESIKVREKLNVKRICYQWESFIDRI